MAIKDKDGNIYRLRGPNPLVANKSEWDIKDAKLINLKFKSEIQKDEKTNPVVEFKEKVVDIAKEINLKPEGKNINSIDFINEIKESNIEKANIVKLPKSNVESPTETDNINKLLNEKGDNYHCVPAISETEHTDTLYGYTRKTTNYGETFVFRGIVIDRSDLQLQIWTTMKLS